MLVFIIPLKSPQVSKSWTKVCQIFNRTIQSICNQSIGEFRVLVVCSEKPNIKFNHNFITYIQVDFPIPASDYESKELDRTRKVLTGLIYAKQLNPSHIMCVDADDCVSRHIAEYVKQHPQSYGWFIKKGYVYKDGANIIRIMRKGFDQFCGTSHIIRYDCFDLPETVDEDEHIQLIYKYYLHRQVRNTLANKGIAIEPLPFAGAVYVVGNTENIYVGVEDQGRKISLQTRLLRMKALFDNRLLTRSIREEFGLFDVSKTPSHGIFD